MTTQTYQVTGMTCGHCVNAVTEELTGVSGVTGVQVDLGKGEVTVTSDAPLDVDRVRDAVDEAGYTLAGTVNLEVVFGPRSSRAVSGRVRSQGGEGPAYRCGTHRFFSGAASDNAARRRPGDAQQNSRINDNLCTCPGH
ncbi:copper ion binding protein [Stackebrandtia albiflava]|uniref:Copper ion binding protein n=1 Tax=Stackebrandtia albiflava TaxID=406432 RepID=A0A562V234_9ACTN|nr:heavy-metal-associated domain-containing protein [Stackebrandtia albiflava]TWJ11893.1 copper ion binding protein [Stackebrandtia albiflava]